MQYLKDIEYLQASRIFAHVIPKSRNSPFRIITDPQELVTWTEVTQSIPRAFVIASPISSTSSPVIVLFHPVIRSDGSFGVYLQIVRTEVHGGKGIILFPLWVDEEGIKRVVLVKHYRPTLGYLPGEGWEIEILSFGQRKGESVLATIEKELAAEGNLSLVGDPMRLDAENSPGCPMLPGITSEVSEVWLAPVQPKPGEPHEKNEGIEGRVCWTKGEFQEALRKGTIMVGNKMYLTNLFHNFVAAQFAEFKGVW